MREDERQVIRNRIVGDLKQACLDLSAAAGELFDRFDEHSIEAAWEGDGALIVIRMQKAHEQLRSFLLRQATLRMHALGVSPALVGAGEESPLHRPQEGASGE